jgi:uncharacterized protein
MDIPVKILGQLGNRVQHALRAFTPVDQKAVKAAATTFRPNPEVDVAQAITELGVGEVLVSFLDEQGTPGIVQRAYVLPPASQVGPITPEQRQQLITSSLLYAHYQQIDDRESAYELLKQKTAQAAEASIAAKAQAEAAKQAAKQAAQSQKQAENQLERERTAQAKAEERAAREREKMLINLAGTAGQALAGSMGKSIARGVLGSILGRG